MKRMLAILFVAAAFAATSRAALKVVGDGVDRRFDPTGWPAEMQQNYQLMEVKCSVTDCHSLDRTVEAVTSGVMPLSKKTFDKKEAKAYGVKMMRMPNSGIDKSEAKTLVELMYWMIDESSK
jgi:hypothetical protein